MSGYALSWACCRCGTPIVLPAAPALNEEDHHDPENVARLIVHLTDHYARIHQAARLHAQLDRWENEGGPA